MDQEPEYVTLDTAAQQIGVKKGALYYYFRALDIKRHKFEHNKYVYITKTDVERIQAVRERPWTISKDEYESPTSE